MAGRLFELIEAPAGLAVQSEGFVDKRNAPIVSLHLIIDTRRHNRRLLLERIKACAQCRQPFFVDGRRRSRPGQNLLKFADYRFVLRAGHTVPSCTAGVVQERLQGREHTGANTQQTDDDARHNIRSMAKRGKH
jgi:hypothetical protein